MELFGLHNKDGREYKLVENGVYWNASPVKPEKKHLPKTKDEFYVMIQSYYDKNTDLPFPQPIEDFLEDYED